LLNTDSPVVKASSDPRPWFLFYSIELLSPVGHL